jgi:hypothetical protein
MAFFPFWRCVGQDAFERRRIIAPPPQLFPAGAAHGARQSFIRRVIRPYCLAAISKERANAATQASLHMSLIRPPSRANSIDAPRGGGLSGFAPPPTTKLATPVGGMSRPLSAGGQARKSAAAAVAGDGVRAAMGWGAPPTTLSRPPSAGGSSRPGILGYYVASCWCGVADSHLRHRSAHDQRQRVPWLGASPWLEPRRACFPARLHLTPLQVFKRK